MRSVPKPSLESRIRTGDHRAMFRRFMFFMSALSATCNSASLSAGETQSAGTNWVLAAENFQGADFYIDTATITRVQSEVSAWIKRVPPKGSQQTYYSMSGNDWSYTLYSLYRLEFDCAKHYLKFVEVYEVTERQNQPRIGGPQIGSTASLIVPDTWPAAIEPKVCKLR